MEIIMPDHALTLSISTEDRIALRKLASEHRQLTGKDIPIEKLAVALLRDALVLHGGLEAWPDLDEGSETAGSA
jgi:hypothetical protein